MSAGSLRTDWRFVVAVVCGGHFLSHVYLLAFPPLFPLLAADFGLSNAQLGLAVSAMSVATLLQMPVGALVDRLGARRVFVASIGLMAAGVALVGLAGSYGLLLAFAGLSGLGQSGVHPADYAILEAVTDVEVQGRSFSVHTFSGFAGFTAAPVVVGTLGLVAGWGTALLAVGAVGLLYAVFAGLALRWVEPSVSPGATDADAAGTGDADAAVGGDSDADQTDDPDAAVGHSDPADDGPRGSGDGAGSDDAGEESGVDDSRVEPGLAAVLRPDVLVLFGFFVLLTLGSKGVHTFTPVLAVETFGFAESTGNLVLTAFLGASALGVLVGGVLADSRDPRRVALAAPMLVGAGVGVVVADLLPARAAALIALFAVLGFTAGLTFPSRDRLVSAVTPAGGAGRSYGFVFTGGAVGSLVAPALLGVVIDASTPVHAFALVAGFYVAAGVVAAATAWVGDGEAAATTGVSGD